VKELLEALVADRKRAIRLLKETREALSVRFNDVDRINNSFT
jgi:tRNA G26 N,N-dimethylase Trm1